MIKFLVHIRDKCDLRCRIKKYTKASAFLLHRHVPETIQARELMFGRRLGIFTPWNFMNDLRSTCEF